MTEWMVLLQGEAFDLEGLPEQFTSPELRVVKEGDEYLLRSTNFDSLGTAEAVNEQAKQLCRKLNGAARAYFGNHRNVRVSKILSIDDQGNRTFHINVSGEINARGRVQATLSVSSGGSVSLQEKPVGTRIIALADQDDAVNDLIYYLAYYKPDWFELYKVYEVLRHDVGGEDELCKQLNISETLLELFRRTANSLYRHRRGGQIPPNNPMTLREAEVLITGLVRRWLEIKGSGK